MSDPNVDPGVPSAGFHSPRLGKKRQDDHVAYMSASWQLTLADPDAAHTFKATAWNLGSVVVAANDFPARRVARRDAMVRADQLDHYYIHLPLDDRGLQVGVGGDVVNVPAGAPVMMDLGRPFDTHQGAGHSVQVFMPREAFDELLPSPRDLHATPLRGAAAGMLAEHLRTLIRRLPSMTQTEAGAVATATTYLVLASLAPTGASLERARPAIESSLLRQACRYIEIHLKEPTLGAETVCAALKISRTTLYRLFEPYGGVSNHVKERRLLRIHAVVSGSTQHLSLSRVAEDHGFKSAAHFSRAFRQQFGYSPSEVPSTNIAPPSALGCDARPGAGLAAWLRLLRG